VEERAYLSLLLGPLFVGHVFAAGPLTRTDQNPEVRWFAEFRPRLGDRDENRASSAWFSCVDSQNIGCRSYKTPVSIKKFHIAASAL
jgi:hypothetical protein